MGDAGWAWVEFCILFKSRVARALPRGGARRISAVGASSHGGYASQGQALSHNHNDDDARVDEASCAYHLRHDFMLG